MAPNSNSTMAVPVDPVSPRSRVAGVTSSPSGSGASGKLFASHSQEFSSTTNVFCIWRLGHFSLPRFVTDLSQFMGESFSLVKRIRRSIQRNLFTRFDVVTSDPIAVRCSLSNFVRYNRGYIRPHLPWPKRIHLRASRPAASRPTPIHRDLILTFLNQL